MAHSIGLIAACTSGVLMLLLGFGTTLLFVILLGIGLARSGGTVLHGLLPLTLREGPPPTPDEVSSAHKGVFGPSGLTNASEFAEEYGVLVENIAFAATYGKTNCLTNAMYTGELTLGKVCSLVGKKLSEGTLRC